MKLKHLFIFLLWLSAITIASAQDVQQMRRHVRRGNRMMHSGLLNKAYEEYLKAFNADSTSALANYNLARSMFPKEWKIMKPGQQTDSIVANMLQHFSYAGDENHEPNPLRRSMAYHNMGVIHQIRANQGGDQKTQLLQQAIESYKQALRLNPHDDEARYNMVLCQRQLPKDNGSNSQQPQQDEQKEQQEEQQQQQQDQQQQQEQQQPQEQQQQNQEMIEQLLNAVEQREKQTRRKIDEQRQNSPNRRQRNEKNW